MLQVISTNSVDVYDGEVSVAVSVLKEIERQSNRFLAVVDSLSKTSNDESSGSELEKKNLSELPSMIVSCISRLQKKLEENKDESQQIPTEVQVSTTPSLYVDSRVLNYLKELVIVAQDGTIGQIKALLFMTDFIADRNKEEFTQIFRELHDKIDKSFDHLDNQYNILIANDSVLLLDLKQYAEDAIQNEQNNSQQLNDLMDRIFETARSSRSHRGSPEGRRFESPN